MQADETGLPELRPLAISRYRRSVALIAAQLLRETDLARRDSLLKFAQLYQQRSTTLATAHGLRASPADELDLSSAEACALLSARPLLGPGTGALPASSRLAHADEDLLRAALREVPEDGSPPSSGSVAGTVSHALVEGWRKTYWLCGQLALSIERGAHITPDRSVFVPSAVWLQRGVRLSALAAKGAAFDELIEQTAPMATLLPPPSSPPPFFPSSVDAGSSAAAHSASSADASVIAASTDYDLLLRECGLYVEFIDVLHATLARTLPPSCNVSPPYASPNGGPGPGGTAGGAMGQPGVQPSDSSDAAASRLRKLSFLVARTASSFVGASSDRPCADSAAYASQLRQLLLGFASLARLHELCAAPNVPPALGRALHLLERARAFVHEVVLALVSQDLSVLLASYLRKAEEGFVLGDTG